mmetsp:Transcript_12273/g.29973  ORF Transcript_12273/g.29973 Transcript_12273/m.29973 type:complete len:111 (+) Transcript_12273:75-407(+)|eukprot:CAMPEP_0202868520 /NCGR_PEP_ID=MMETSP1391-20130828/10923_1 /ASSEMBLY_ACC=CAM_ASM_000867 /TAXON_ID=1034604 /ORGANISM="Chlamydomonas leiostraca, Strain SAG 11-49" /LENGTH=110 /DNA_ID=CAMNT_0049548699 /DNA_START=70 /DNA_END=402 /DNA_ORIENTATION=-
MSQEHEEGWVSRQAENKIAGKLGLLAEKHCKSLIEAYNMCAKGRSFSMMWACRKRYADSQDCVHLYVNDSNLTEVKTRWIAADRPRKPDWNVLLAGMDVAPEQAAKSKAG